jgi:Fe-S oxidoreductase
MYIDIIKIVVFILLFLSAIVLFSFKVIKLLKYLKIAQPENRFQDTGKRLWKVITIAFGQSKLFREKFAGILHFFIFWGFIILLLAILESILEGFNPDLNLSFLGPIYKPLLFLEEIMGVLVIISVLSSIGRRLIHPPKRLKVDTKHKTEAILILIWIFLIMTSMFFTFAGRYAYTPDYLIAERFFSTQISTWLPETSFSLTISEIAWWAHIILVLGFLNYLPYSKHLHILTSIPNVYLSNLGIPGILKPINFEREGLEKFGVVDVEDFTWKEILDGFTCTECGRCTASCPANITGKILSPKEVIMKIRERSFQKFPLMLDDKNNNTENASNLTTKLIGDFIAEEALWDCTTCISCLQECPVMIEHVVPIIDLRRSLVMMESRFPEELNATFKNLENNFSPWAFSPAERMDWAQGLKIKTLSEDKNVDYLYWVGCAGAFDQRYKKVARAFVEILNKADINFGVLGTEEKCTGDAPRKMGNEYLAQMLIKENISTLNNYNIKNIITTCPHCYNALKNEYPAFGGNYNVIHHTGFINDLINNRKLKLKPESKDKITYHDSCYLGRYNRIYDAPREILEKVNGNKLIEMKRNYDKGFCCGAGGGRMFMEEKSGKKVNVERIEEVMSLDCGTVASACPFCMTMLEDGLKFKDADEKIQVKDIAEIVLENLV